MKSVKRPVIVSVICVISFAATVLSFPSIFSPFVKKQGVFFPALSGLVIAFEFIAVVGVWYMKKWGVQIYVINAMLGQALQLSINNWSVFKLILPIIFIFTTAFFYKRMDDNL